MRLFDLSEKCHYRSSSLTGILPVLEGELRGDEKQILIGQWVICGMGVVVAALVVGQVAVEKKDLARRCHYARPIYRNETSTGTANGIARVNTLGFFQKNLYIGPGVRGCKL